MNGLPEGRSIKEVIATLFDRPIRGVIMEYLRALRYVAYYKNTMKTPYCLKGIHFFIWHRRLNKLSLKLGFSIGVNSLGYGVVIPHHGTIVVNENARIGNYAVLHTSTCIAGGEKNIGDYFYLSAGSQVVGKLTLGDGVSVAAHSLVNCSYGDRVLLVGSPAMQKHDNYPLWVERDGVQFEERVKKTETLKSVLYKL